MRYSGGPTGGRYGGQTGGGYGGRTGSFRFGHGFPMSKWVKRLLIANFAIFVLTMTGIIPRAAIPWLGFSVAGFPFRPWSAITYMFLHGGFMHVFMNMVVLYFFGPPLERKWGSRYFLKYYLLTGLGGAASLVLLNSFVGPALMIGASGAIYGLLVAFALNWPNAKIFLYFVFPVPAKWFVAGLGFFALLSTAQGSLDGVAHWAHLGGLATGFILLRFGERIGWATMRLRRAGERIFFKDATDAAPKKRPRRAGSGYRPRAAAGPRPSSRGSATGFDSTTGFDSSTGFGSAKGFGSATGFDSAGSRPRGAKGDGSPDRGGSSGPGSKRGSHAGRRDSRDEIDRLLDKIRVKGIDSLTRKERAFLDEVSRQYQETRPETRAR